MAVARSESPWRRGMSQNSSVRVLRLSGIRQFTPSDEEPPGVAGEDDVEIEVGAVGICGSDIHLYENGRIGSTAGKAPFVLGHEFMGSVRTAGPDARDGTGARLTTGVRVAVDPQVPCHRCEWCRRGDSNLCPHHRFLGLYPDDGALRERMLVPARNCFSLPDDISDAGGAVLETLGVAIHAVDLAKVRAGQSCAVIGCGAVGLLILRLARLAGLEPLLAIDPLPWRVELARKWGATEPVIARAENAVEVVRQVTSGRGCDVVFEAAWVGETAGAAMEHACPGGRIVLVGIPGQDTIAFPHSLARRKGLTLYFSRRMRPVYPRAIALASGPDRAIDLDALVTHQCSLSEAPAAFAMAAGYTDDVIKAVIHPNRAD